MNGGQEDPRNFTSMNDPKEWLAANYGGDLEDLIGDYMACVADRDGFKREGRIAIDAGEALIATLRTELNEARAETETLLSAGGAFLNDTTLAEHFARVVTERNEARAKLGEMEKALPLERDRVWCAALTVLDPRETQKVLVAFSKLRPDQAALAPKGQG